MSGDKERTEQPLRVGTIRTVQHREKPASDYPEVVVGQETLIWTGTDWVEVRKLVAKADAVDRVGGLHYRVTDDGPDFCHECANMWPCRTIRALNGEQS